MSSDNEKVKKMKILVTGGCGFIGSHFVEHIIRNTDWDIVVLDKLTYASSGFDRLRDINVFDDKRINIFTYDFTNELDKGLIKEIGNIDYIVHIGAETHVDKSIENPEPFVMSNIVGTMRILNFARKIKDSLKWLVYFSTDEVTGPAPRGINFTENAIYNCKNPYAATKAGAEQLCLAYENCYKIPLFITRTMNCFGERQDVEKFIPLTIRKVLLGETVIIHSDHTRIIPGSRFYIHARNVSSAVIFLLDKAKTSEIYNIVGEKEIDNLELAQFIAKVIGKPLSYRMLDFHSSRPGHDLRYGLDGTKMVKLGWNIAIGFEQSLEKMIKWTLDNRRWINL